MKLSKLNILLMSAALVVAASGCKKHPTPLTNLPGSGHSGVVPPGPGDLSNGNPLPPPPVINNQGNIAPTDPSIRAGWAKDADSLKPQTIYFDYDKSSIKSSERSKLEDVANYLKANPEKAVLVTGNCDERGTEEYNRSLGERRSLAARESLVKLGIDAGRVDTISYGKDKPAVDGHDESAWSKNRRDEFIVEIPPKP